MDAASKVRDAIDALSLRVTNDRGSDYMAQCPAHDDGKASLHITARDGRVAMYCHAGCDTNRVCEALSLELRDLFDDDPTDDKPIVSATYTYMTASGKPWLCVDRLFPKSFRQRTPDAPRGDYSKGMAGREPILYRLPQVLDAIRAGRCIWIVEGEKDVHSMESKGEVATTCPMGAGKWREAFSLGLSRAGATCVNVLRDNDEPGMKHAREVQASLRSYGIKARVYRPASGKDATDHFTNGFTVDQFELDPEAKDRPRGITHAELTDRVFEPIIYCVKDLLPTGLAMLAGGPKSGKSWIALDIALGVGSGGRALSSLEVTQGSVLYLAREDNDRRLQSRCDFLMGETDAHIPAIEFHSLDSEWPTGVAGLAAMTEWAEEVENPRLVVLDTLAKIEPEVDEKAGGNLYRAEYAMAARYKAWADRFNLCLLMIHHDRKTNDDDDWTKKISGSRGLTGALDTILYLDAKRGSRDGVLHMTGRDVDDADVELLKVGPIWTATGRPGSASGTSSDFLRELVTFVHDNPDGVEVGDVITQFGDAHSEAKVRVYLSRAVKSGRLAKLERGVYGPV